MDYLKGVGKYLPLRTRLLLRRNALMQKWASRDSYVVAVSEYLACVAKENSISTMDVAANCLDTDKYTFSKQDRNGRGLFVGANNYYAKGIDILEEISSRGIRIDCVSSARPSAQLGFVGTYSNEELIGIYQRYQILLLPSRSEGFGLVAIEAMSCGMPVIISSVGLGATLLKEIPEFVVTTGKPEDYAERFALISDRYAFYSQAAREYVERKHSLVSYAEIWKRILEEVCHSYGGGCLQE
jgi:glycosyltransferase involved in cell wall biosynthesis